MRLQLIIILLANIYYLNGQDQTSTRPSFLKAYPFNIEEGILVGAGAEFLRAEMADAQFTLLGEYHGSYRISEFTNAIIPILDSAGYKSIVLEVGQFAGKRIDNITSHPEKELKAIYEKYKFSDDSGDFYLPFPFLENEEDLSFFNSYKKLKWKTIGVDQEYYDGLVLLFDMMFDNLTDAEKIKHSATHSEVIDSLKHYYLEDNNNDKSIMAEIESSPLIANYFSTVSSSEENSKIIASIYHTAKIYENDWYTSYSLRVQHMKNNLREQFINNNFDLSSDKLLAKMGAYHLSKGFSLWGAYEIGNTFHEMAAYQGNSALNIIFLNRYHQDDDKVIDLMDSTDPRNTRYNVLRQYGEQTEWVVIDLRSAIKKYISKDSAYTLNEYVEEYMKTYDLVIIPKIELNTNPIIKK